MAGRLAAPIMMFAVAVSAGLASGLSSPASVSASEQLGLAIPMRDSVRLAADVFLPDKAGRWPSILIRTPYNRKARSSASYRYFARHGFAVVIQDVRGRYASQGVFGSTAQEGPDGNDTLNWIAAQPWSDGRIGMAGSSYLGIAQWWAALQANPHLKTISPMYSGDDEYMDRFYSQGGALQAGHRLLWLAENLTPVSHVRALFSSYITHVPFESADIPAAGTVLPEWRKAIAHPSYDWYWKRRSIRGSIHRVGIPVLSWGGWFDEYAESDLDAFSRLARNHTRVETWMGPWPHDPSWKFPTLDFGPQARVSIREKQLQWFNYWLREDGSGEAPETEHSTEAKLHIFVMGPNIWREEHEWPLSRARATPLYLGSGGHANTGAGDGSLQWEPVSAYSSDAFVYDPKHPVPTAGGAICCEATVLPPGPLDQSLVEKRSDVLVYTSGPLGEEIEVTGTVRVVLYVSTSANDTDFTAKLVDVGRDGRPLLVTDGIQRLRYRLSLDEPVLVRRNTAYRITIDAGVTSYVFPRGHAIRLEISSSNFPRFDRNLNSPQPVARESNFRKARQVVYHDGEYPSALILPIVPKPQDRHEKGRSF